MSQANHDSSCLDSVQRDASLDSLCDHCRVLQLDDAKHGVSIQLTKDGKRHVSFGVLVKSWRGHSEPVMKPPSKDGETKPYPSVEVKLGYEREDTFPDLLGLAFTASQGCQMCTLLRNDILSLWEQEQPQKPQWPSSRNMDRCLELPQNFEEGSQNEIDREIEGKNSRGANGYAKLHITELVYQYRDPDDSINSCPETASDQCPWLDALYVCFEFSWQHAKQAYSLHYNFHTDPSGKMAESGYTYYADLTNPDPCASWLNVGRQTVPPESLSGSRLARLKALISKSLERIPVPKTIGYLPTRLIDVSSSESKNTRLVISNEHFSVVDSDDVSARQYVALSYCWGPKKDAEKQLKTTRETINNNLRCIELQKMPKTIADAVEVCRLLGIRYIWIDALCIVQDDMEDWSKESFEMANVFANSLLTFCILRGNSCLSGFLHPPRLQPRVNINFRSTLDPSVQGKLRLSMLNSTKKNSTRLLPGRKGFRDADTPAEDDINDSSWSTRAWILQEARLSPRKILFGDRMFHMSCERLSESEDGTVFTGNCWGEEERLSQNMSHEMPTDIGNVMDRWYALVMTYKRKQLSYVTDRLPAISALARLISNRYPEQEYLAGLWKSDLYRSLLWVTFASKSHAAYLEDLTNPYIAPSWSWACHPHMVYWLGVGAPAQFNPELKVADYHLLTHKANPYGCIYGGHLTLNAKAVPFPLSHDGRPKVHTAISGRNDGDVRSPFALLLRSDDSDYIAHLHIDWDFQGTLMTEQYPDGPIERLWMVLVSNSKFDTRYMDLHPYLTDPEFVIGLLLLPTDNEQAFTKVGLWYSENIGLGGRKFWDNINPRDVKLV